MRSNKHRNGSVMIWGMVTMTVIVGISALAFDLARVQIVKTEMRRAADAAAHAAAREVNSVMSAVRAAARQYAGNNLLTDTAGGLTLENSEIIRGKWNAQTRTLDTSSMNPDAVRIIARRTAQKGNAVPLIWASLLKGQNTCDINVMATAVYITPVNVEHSAPGTANPFLAGMPKGSSASLNNPHNSPDYTGVKGKVESGPKPVAGLPIVPGTELTFDQISGTVRHDPNLPYFNPDGELTDIGHNSNGNENGITDVIAPINSLVGVFLTDEEPHKYMQGRVPPPRLDFSTPASRDFTKLEPKIQQIFFIGDSRTSKGEIQRFVVPEGATRLYLATWDFYEWNNNDGDRVVRVIRPGKTMLVE
jgi:Flp pilus assembly protein TadG